MPVTLADHIIALSEAQRRIVHAVLQDAYENAMRYAVEPRARPSERAMCAAQAQSIKPLLKRFAEVPK